MTDMSDDEGDFETLAFDDIRRWQAARKVVDSAISSLRTAGTEEEVGAATRELYLAAARARDFESRAIDLMKRYGYAAGVDVPEIGRVRVQWMNDGMKVLEVVTRSATATATERESPVREPAAGEHPVDRVYGTFSRSGGPAIPIESVDAYIGEIRGR